MTDKKYAITASDIDKEAIKIAENNAKRAGVADTITFENKDFKSYVSEYIS